MTVADHRPIVKTIVWHDESETAGFARSLAAQPGIAGALIALRGDLGAGKTSFVRHLLGALGVTGRVKSPSYTVVEPYSLDPSAERPCAMDIWHFDFYRFNDPNEWEEAGFRDTFASRGLKLVEWPDKAGAHLPQPDLSIGIAVGEGETRNVTLTSHTPTGAGLLAGV
ncbi:MAG: tRNA (adenosine(37)-N6)-threonylcarbamoyltransferase complex ATPase subunit type 1 TsaE [Polaromonas sp.]|nr:tRNA (adenosine(37)-N6)-threonylcarbamoyltransferase complex ATPase subunit type 1 TsaE [Polaromonas sp.]